jgi:hypothetical protein
MHQKIMQQDDLEEILGAAQMCLHKYDTKKSKSSINR